MLRLYFLKEKLHLIYGSLCVSLVCLIRSIYWMCTTIYDLIVYHFTHFWIEVFYFILVSCFGLLVLKGLKPRTSYPIRSLDLFFTSVSATTVSSMSTVEMEVFSNSQLVILTLLMFIGGEVFTSMVGLHFMASKLKYIPLKARSRINSVANLPLPSQDFYDHIEMGTIIMAPNQGANNNTKPLEKTRSEIDFLLKSKSIKVLGYVVLAYLLIVHFLGISMVLIYVNVFKSAKNVLESKGIKSFTFSMFTIVSTFASCGFVPTNENMIVFKKNSGLLWMLIPQILLGNTLYPSAIRFSIWVFGKFAKKCEVEYLLNNTKDIKYTHWLPSSHARFLVATVFGFILAQFVLFCAMGWSLEGLRDLNVYQRVVGILFQCVNSRHTGESIVDLSTIASAILVVFIVMMYLPPYTSFVPVKDEDEDDPYPQSFMLNNGEKKRAGIIKVDNFIFSQLSYLIIFIIIICITERQKIRDDPLNFNVLNIVVEVISAYGNVGFSTGYSCERQLKPDATCVDKWYGFAGKWSDEGKIVLIIVMFFGRLKKFNMNGGKAWVLL